MSYQRRIGKSLMKIRPQRVGLAGYRRRSIEVVVDDQRVTRAPEFGEFAPEDVFAAFRGVAPHGRRLEAVVGIKEDKFVRFCAGERPFEPCRPLQGSRTAS